MRFVGRVEQSMFRMRRLESTTPLFAAQRPPARCNGIRYQGMLRWKAGIRYYFLFGLHHQQL